MSWKMCNGWLIDATSSVNVHSIDDIVCWPAALWKTIL